MMAGKSSRLVPKAPPPTSAQASITMRGNKRKDTRPELAVRRTLSAMGYRYRLHPDDLPGKPDIVFRGRKIAIFVHGCFWHQHDNPGCPLRAKPHSNLPYWEAKLARNVQRDGENMAALSSTGWRSIIVWECETQSPSAIAAALAAAFS
jgi:DNA mismatch endonuclease, patch repair protein